MEVGTTFFDTAEVYGFGLSEELLGQFVQQSNRPVQIATKYGPAPWRFTAQSVSDALTGSLKRLRVEQVALYQVHWPFSFLMSQETLMNALADEVQRGRLEAVGVSNYSAAEMREAHQILAARGVRLATNQVRYSLITRQIESQGILDTARELGITILAYSPLAQGLLTGKYTAESSEPTGARRLDSRFSKDGLKKLAPVISLLRQLGEKHGHTPAQVALNWLIAQGNVIAIAGAKTPEQVRQNAGALGWKLSDDEITQLEQVSRPWLQ
jgi:aryl-alcohol dehydrogenase-like predicted oxidoreductase